MAHLTPADVQHIARIARLSLTPEEGQRLAREAEAILAHFEAVMRAPAAALAERPAQAPRDDAVEGPNAAQADAIVAQFPRKDGRRAKVPGGL